MAFAPIRPDRCLLWITLQPDGTVKERYAALRAILKECRLHPLDTTPVSEVVIVEEVALRARLESVRAALGPGDILHLISHVGERLHVTVIAPEAIQADPPQRPPERRPPWLRDS